jgi:CubicO group peptidase (beta-lactamase class C family)
MTDSFLTTPKHWYGRGTRRDLLGAMAAGIGAAGFGLAMTRTAAIANGTYSPVAIANAAQSGYAWVANHGLDGDAYQGEFESLAGQGYRLIKLCGYSVYGQDYYASIWDMSPGPAWVGMHRVPGADYQAQFDSLTAQGYRPVDISGYEKDGSDYYTAIFEQSSASWSASHGVAGADYQGVFDSNVAAGMRPLRVSGFTVGGADYFASIWVGDDGTPWAAGHGMDNATYQSEFDRWTGEGLRLVDISGYEFNGTDYYAAIFDGSPKSYWISHHNLSADAYQAAFNENGASGYVLTHVAGYGVGGEARFAAIWASDTDPTGGTVGVAAVDKIATDMLATAGVPGVSVAIAKDGLLVYAKGYGTADASTGEALTVQHRMRVASVSKPITAAAILQLAENGVLTLNDTVFGSGGWLGSTYGTKAYTADLQAVTIDHLVNHTVGVWGGNTMFQHPEYTMDELITWTLDTFPLSGAPGAMFTYSNFGYCLLGRIIEAAMGQSYESYVQSTVLAQCGISDMQIAGDSLAERAANEVVYDGSNSTIGDPYGIPVRRMDAHGGWIATATDLVRFMVRMDDFPNPADIVTAASLGDMGWGGATNNWGHTGQLGGAEAVISRRTDGICYAVIGNGNGFDPDKLGADMAYAITDWGTGTAL